MRPLLLLALALIGSPALADVWPGPSTPDPGRARAAAATAVSAGWRTPAPLPAAATKVDAEGTRYSDQDVRLGFLPVPPDYRRFGGGLVRIYNPPAAVLVPGLDTPATITRLMDELPDPPGSSDPPAPPTPKDPHDVPGPLGLGALVGAWRISRQLRRRIRG